MDRCTRGIFITATGTDIGKTYFSGLLVKKLRSHNINCGYYKPVLSGAEEIEGKLVPGDCVQVLKTSGLEVDPLSCVSYVFKPAVSPHFACESISLEKIINDFNAISENYDFMVVEGAGGIICPLNLSSEPFIMADLIKHLGLDIIIVADSGLGTINSTILTIEYAKQKGIEIKGIVMNNFDDSNPMHVDNLKTIEKLSGINIIAKIKTDAVELDEVVL